MTDKIKNKYMYIMSIMYKESIINKCSFNIKKALAPSDKKMAE